VLSVNSMAAQTFGGIIKNKTSDLDYSKMNTGQFFQNTSMESGTKAEVIQNKLE